MGLKNFFSKRKAAAAKAGVVDVYQYEQLPDSFRVQVVHIWKRAIGEMPAASRGWELVWDVVDRDLSEEHGVMALGHEPSAFERVGNYFLRATNIDVCLDVLESTFGAMEHGFYSDPARALAHVTQQPDGAIADLNQRFREHGVGYQYLDGQIVRVDSEFLHAEAVKPAITLLGGAGFEGPREEFLQAHEHYRHGKGKEAMNDALKAFESTMKAICDKRKWHYERGANASKLVGVILYQGLVPKYFDSSWAGLRSVLEGAVPTPRNRESAHGQGADPAAVQDPLVAYVLHVTASNIVFLIDSHMAMP